MLNGYVPMGMRFEEAVELRKIRSREISGTCEENCSGSLQNNVGIYEKGRNNF